MTRKQSWFLLCALGLDVRHLGISVRRASRLIDEVKKANNKQRAIIKENLIKLGAIDKKPIKKDWAEVWEYAKEIGMEAGYNCVPTPMVVEQHNNIMDDNSEIIKTWTINEGVCGFVWICVDGRSSFGRWAIKSGIFKKTSMGVIYFVHEFGQSYERKIAFAKTIVDFLCRNGVNVYYSGRLD